MWFLTSREQVAPQGIGKPIKRREDARLLTGGGITIKIDPSVNQVTCSLDDIANYRRRPLEERRYVG
jgi:hypothetical protein